MAGKKKAASGDVAKAKTLKLRDLTPDDKNANRGTARGMGMLEESIQSFGMGRPIFLDKNQRIVAGNKTHEVATDVLPEQEDTEVIILETEGDELIANQRMDLDMDADPRARMLGLADNRVGEVNIEYDKEVLAGLRDEGLDLKAVGFLDHEQEAMFRSLISEQIADSAPSGGGHAFDDEEEGDDLGAGALGSGGERASAAPADLSSMHVRMVQVVFTKEQYDEYESMTAELGKMFGTNTPTDTIWQTVMSAEETTREVNA